MKRTLALILTAVLAVPVFAQTQEDPELQRFTMRAGAAYVPTVPVLLLPFIAVGAGLGAALSNSEGVTVDSTLPPVASLEFLYSFNDRWSAGMDVSYAGFSYTSKDKEYGEIKSQGNISLVPVMAEGRFNYISHQSFKFYGALEAGIMLSVQEGVQVVPSFQVNPLGIEFGRKFFGHVEFGAGMNYIGMRGGVGLRF